MGYVWLNWKEVPVGEITGRELGFVIPPSNEEGFEAIHYARWSGLSYASICGASEVRNRAYALRGTDTAMVVTHV